MTDGQTDGRREEGTDCEFANFLGYVDPKLCTLSSRIYIWTSQGGHTFEIWNLKPCFHEALEVIKNHLLDHISQLQQLTQLSKGKLILPPYFLIFFSLFEGVYSKGSLVQENTGR